MPAISISNPTRSSAGGSRFAGPTSGSASLGAGSRPWGRPEVTALPRAPRPEKRPENGE